MNATAQFLYSQLGSNLITQKQSDFEPEDFFIREEWSGGLGHCNWIGDIQAQAPLGGRLGFGTEPCYESAGDLHRVKQVIFSIVAQNWPWSSQMIDKNVNSYQLHLFFINNPFLTLAPNIA